MGGWKKSFLASVVGMVAPALSLAEDDVLAESTEKIRQASEGIGITIVNIVMWGWLGFLIILPVATMAKAWSVKKRLELQGGGQGSLWEAMKEALGGMLIFWIGFALYTVLLTLIGINPLTAIQTLFQKALGAMGG
jgi:hypothetical protein